VFDGVDGKPRFEVDDSGAKLKRQFRVPGVPSREYRDVKNSATALEREMSQYDPKTPEFDAALKQYGASYEKKLATPREGTNKLGDVLNHKALFEQYPDVQDTKVVFKKMDKDSHGSAGSGSIEINSRIPKKKQLETLLHEVQHVIQDKEGFAAGGNP